MCRSPGGRDVAKLCSILFAVFALATLQPCLASHAASDGPGQTAPSGQYCGLYALYTVLRIEGRPVNFRDLLRPEYIGSVDGSSSDELRRAATDFGLSALNA